MPALLPPAVGAFAGRAAEIERLEAVDAGVVVVSGTAGVGKTALTVHWAHRVAPNFPDGQLYVNLRGFDPAGSVVEPALALGMLLEALGVPSQQLPVDVEGRVALYRERLAGRRVLIVLDNARDAAQVRPLLPGHGHGHALTLVTSRDRLAAVEAELRVPLELMTGDEARELLRRRLGDERLADEPGAVDEIVRRCARLPLAMSVVAAHAAARPGVTLARLAAQLRDAAAAWAVLDGGDAVSDVRAVLSWSYLALSPAPARLFRLLGAHPGREIGVAAAASLGGLSPAETAAALGELVRASLLDEQPAGRYGHHDLLRGYARELAQRDGDDGAGRRVLDHYLHTSVAAALAVNPSGRQPVPPPAAAGVVPESLPDAGAARRWLADELPVLLAAIAEAAQGPAAGHAWRLAWALTDELERRGRWDEWEQAHEAGLRAAERLEDPVAGAHLHRGLGRLRMWRQRYPEARTHLTEALDRFTAHGALFDQARAEHNLCQLAESEGRLPEAVTHAERALALARADGDRPGVAKELNALGWCLTELGDDERARAVCEEAAAIYRDFDDPAQEAPVQHSLGHIHRRLGRPAAAVACYERALALTTVTGDRFGEAAAHDGLGDARHALGDGPGARAAWTRALEILADLQHPDASAVAAKLGDAGP